MSIVGAVVNNWYHRDQPELGFMNTVSESISQADRSKPGSIPNFRGFGTFIIASDFGGLHSDARYEVYSFLLTNAERLGQWSNARADVRRRFLRDGRRMSYKVMNDRVRRRALAHFLAASNLIPGLIATVAVNRRIQSLFTKSGRFVSDSPETRVFATWARRTAERCLRAVHLASLFLRGLSTSGQDVFWVTDEEDVVANEDRLRAFIGVFANLSSQYLPHDLRHFRMATTSSDSGSRYLEDLTAICDMAAGSIQDILKEDFAQALLRSPSLWLPRMPTTRAKVGEIMDWFADSSQPLKRLTLVVDEVDESRQLRLTKMLFHGSYDTF